MATLTIKNIPETVYRRLKRRAAQHHRSLNQEMIACLERAAKLPVPEPDTLLKEARALRQLYKGPPVTEKLINRLKREGRR